MKGQVVKGEAMTKCDVCWGADRPMYFLENDRVRDKRLRRKYQYNVLCICDKCYREWAAKLEGPAKLEGVGA